MNRDQERAMFAGRNQNAHLLSKNYFDKQSSSADYLRDKAEKQRELASHLHSRNDSILGAMNGTPILIGHHSEGRHRRAIEKIHNDERKGYEATDYAKALDKKADNKLNSYAISSDDPDAVVKLKQKLERLEEEKAEIKSREHKGWELSNIGATIRNTKQRIEILKKKADMPEIEEQSQSGNGVSFKVDKEDNRIRIYFDGKPSEEIRTRLKSRAWRWSPKAGAWQKQISEQALEQAKSYL